MSEPDSQVGEQLLTTPEVAKWLSFNENYLRIMRLSGRGPAFLKLGKSVRYRKAAVEEWLNKHCVTSTSDTVAA